MDNDPPAFTKGDQVSWLRVRSHSHGIGLKACYGVVDQVGEETAKIRLRNNQRTWVKLSRLRPHDQPTQLTDIVQAMASDVHKEGSAKTAQEREQLEAGFISRTNTIR